jgi:hypothetical protein
MFKLDISIKTTFTHNKSNFITKVQKFWKLFEIHFKFTIYRPYVRVSKSHFYHPTLKVNIDHN